jgi:hemolysin-activating ACP:hemolysin acyltransferase
MTPKDAQPNTIISCYIEADGDLSTVDWPRAIGSNMWKLSWFRPFRNDLAFVSYWHIVFDESSELAIYDKEGGGLLREHEGSGNPHFRSSDSLVITSQ